MFEFVARQGDIAIVHASGISIKRGQIKTEAENGRLVLLRGEATGHNHSVSAKAANFYVFADEQHPSILEGQVIGTLETWQATEITHQEHDTVIVSPGTYFVVQQREYRRGEIRRVLD